jgi:Flp pilus assembly protein TadG
LYDAEAGIASAEAGVTISVLLLLLVGIFGFGQVYSTYNTMLFAVATAGRYAMVHNQLPPYICGTQRQAPGCPILSNTPLANCSAAVAQQILSANQGTKAAISATENTTSLPATMTICTSYSVDLVAPQILQFGPLTLIRQVTVPLL